MTIYDFFTLLGGLAMFLFGMHIMGDSLEKQAGNRLKPILEQLTSSPLKGVLLGAGVTAVIQSSSGTTVMAVGFVNSGIMQLRQAIAVVMGANIGTTITSWLLSLTGIQSDTFLLTLLKPTTFAPLLAFVGIILFMGKKRPHTAGILLGFAVLMLGMKQMSDAVAGLAHVPAFTRLMVLFTNPLLGVLTGALVTAIIQSSSASVGILQAIASTGGLTFGAAFPIIMGQNIGTCATALISAIGANRNAKRVAAAHLLFNLVGTLLFLALFYLLHALLRFPFVQLPIGLLGIAVTHTAFNVLSTAMLYPFMGALEWLARKLVPDDQQAERFALLDERLLATPPIAIQQCRRLAVDMAQHAQQACLAADSLFDKYDERQVELVRDNEEMIDRYEDQLGSFLVKVATQSLSEADSREVSKLLHIIGDFERISDHALNMARGAQELNDKNLSFSDAAVRETAVLRAAVRNILELAVTAFENNDLDMAQRVEPLEQVVDLLRSEIKARHIARLQQGTCTIELGFVLNDLLHNLERVGDHCSNIAASVLQVEQRGAEGPHSYIRNLPTGAAGPRYNQLYREYLQAYDPQRWDDAPGVQEASSPEARL